MGDNTARSTGASRQQPRGMAKHGANLRAATIAFFLSGLVAACGDGGGSPSLNQGALSLPEETLDYQVELPFYYEVNTLLQNPFQTSALFNDNTPADNPVTDEGATLGRVLFYDRRLSSNRQVSCAHPCHLQEFGFSDPEQTSEGVDGRTKRNSMGLANARFYRQRTETLPLPVDVETEGKFFWDERADSLEDQVLMPFQDPVEMGLTLEQLVDIVANQDYYPPLFEAAFGDAEVTSERISKALAQFIRSIVSTESRYDEGRRALAAIDGQPGNGLLDFPTFTDQENRGKRLFVGPRRTAEGRIMGPCGGCHLSDAMISAPSGSVNNGIQHLESPEAIDLIAEVRRGPVRPIDVLGEDGRTNAERYDDAAARLYAWMDDDPDGELGDLGIAEHMDRKHYEPNQVAMAIGAIKAPSLRNIAVTAPYMHDGSFETLEEVLDHYSEGVLDNPHPSLNFAFNGVPVDPGPLRSFNFTEEEKQAIIAFLETLTDPIVLTAERWSDPFERPNDD